MHAGYAKDGIARLYIEQQKKEVAEKILQEVIEQYPDFEGPVLDAKMTLADLKIGDQEFDKALKLYSEIIKAAPDAPISGWAMKRLAEIYYDKGRFRDAEKMISRVIETYSYDKELIKQSQALLKQIYEKMQPSRP